MEDEYPFDLPENSDDESFDTGEAVDEAKEKTGEEPEEYPAPTEEDLDFQKKLRLGKNQLNIASAYSKEGEDVEQITRYAREAMAMFDELIALKPEDKELNTLKNKAERIVIMCTYSSSQLDNLLVEAKELYRKGIDEMESSHEFQARWYFEKCLEKIKPLLVLWGVTPETKSMVEDVSLNLESLDVSSVLRGRKDDEQTLFGMLDRLSLIKDMPIMEIITENNFKELLEMKTFFSRISNETDVKGLAEIFADIDSELYHIYADKIRSTIEGMYRVNLMERQPVFRKILELMESVRSLRIDSDRSDFILGHARDSMGIFIAKTKQMEVLHKLLENREKILRSGFEEVPRADRLNRLLSEAKGGEDSTGFPLKNRDVIYRITDILEAYQKELKKAKVEAEAVTPAETPEAAESKTVETEIGDEEVSPEEGTPEGAAEPPATPVKEPVREPIPEIKGETQQQRLIRIYRSLPDGDIKSEIDEFLDGITADLVFDTTRYTPTKLTFSDDLEEVLESLREQIESLASQKAYLPFVKGEARAPVRKIRKIVRPGE